MTFDFFDNSKSELIMDRHHDSLQNDELYVQCGETIKKSITEMQRHVSSLRAYVSNRRKEIIKQIRSNNEKNEAPLEDTRKFYEYALKELMKLEQVCEQYLLEIKIDLLAEVRDRLQPPTYVSMSEVKRTYEMCKNALVECEDEDESCRCMWKNVLNLEETANILAKPKQTIPTEFDESDLKFKKEIIELRMKMFSLPEVEVKLQLLQDEIYKYHNEKAGPVSRHELSKLNGLKFIDGEFVICDIWSRILDTRGNQLRSKWHFVLCPQIEKLVKKRRIATIHLNPRRTFDFLSNIQENGANFRLTRKDLIHLVENEADVVWLKTWKLQFKAIDGKDVAATLIQAFWRGFWLRKSVWESERLYVAACVLWFHWSSLKKKRQMHERYLTKMLMSLHVTRELSLKLSKEFYNLIERPHVVIHLTSLGYPPEIRRTLLPNLFSIYQNTTILRLSLVRNLQTEVIYVLPVTPTDDLLRMYSDIIESITSDEGVAKRITFVALSQAETFRNLPLNVSRILHCSEESLEEIRRKISGKPAYFLPWIIDECDVRLAGNLDVPLLSADMALQQKLTHMSRITEIIDRLGLEQPPHSGNIKDYDTLCTTLAHLIALHTEICIWIVRLNVGLKIRHYGIFLINHISVPFMPILRRERDRHGEEWKMYSSLRAEFLESLLQRLPKVVSTTTQLSNVYTSWKEFYAHIQKFGCLIQAIPNEKDASRVSVSLFVPGKNTGRRPKWTGTADKIYLEANCSTFFYMIPQTSLNTSKIKPVINKFATAMQEEGYFGYLTVDCYCYLRRREDKLAVLLVNVHPYYSHLQSYIDWLKFAAAGRYRYLTNTFVSEVELLPTVRVRKSSYLRQIETPKWNETTERCAIAISQLYHSRFSAYPWFKLKGLFEDCGITYDLGKKEGAHVILHDGEIRNIAMMVVISSCMATALSMVHNSLKKLHRALSVKTKMNVDTNLTILVDFFAKLSLTYQNLAADQCI